MAWLGMTGLNVFVRDTNSEPKWPGKAGLHRDGVSIFPEADHAMELVLSSTTPVYRDAKPLSTCTGRHWTAGRASVA